MHSKKKRLFITTFLPILTHILTSSIHQVERREPLSILENPIKNITEKEKIHINENFKIETSGLEKLTDSGEPLIEICIYSFLNAKERANLRLLSQFFYQNFNDLYFNPYKILYPRLNLIERKLNDQFIDNVCMAYLFKSKDNPHFFMCSNKNFEEGLILKETWWMESNLNLQNYGSRTFKLDISGGNGSVQISDSVLSNEQLTDPQVGDWIAITTDLTLAKIVDHKNIHITKYQSVKGFDVYKYYFIKKLETDDMGLKKIIVGEISKNSIPSVEPKYGDYWISSYTFKDIRKVKPVSKTLSIVKSSEGIKVTSADLIRQTSFSKSHTNQRSIETKDLNRVFIKFYPHQNQVVVLINYKEFILHNPNQLHIIMKPHEYNFFLKLL